MPTYEYVCKACGHLFEIVQSMRDEPLKECPQCGGELRKVFTPPAISFKGSGFYATDQRQKTKAATSDNDGAKGKKESASKDTSGSKDTGSKETGSKETKEAGSEKKASPAKKGD